MLKMTLLVIPMMMFLSGCTKIGQDSFCQLAHPIYIDKQDKITPNTSREILSHDETGHSYCNWSRV